MRQGSNPYLNSLLAFSWLVPTVFGLRCTSLKERPGRVQAVFIAGLSAIVIAIAFWPKVRPRTLFARLGTTDT
jgi:hypothetical protein